MSLSSYCLRALSICFFICMPMIGNASDGCDKNFIFNIGTGIYDITGPAAETGMMGYGMIDQKTSGILQRLWARAFIIESPCNQKRVVIVNTDLGMVFLGIKQQVLMKLAQKFGNLYSDDNVLLTATHTHSGPGGFSTYAFYNISTLGFSRQNFNVIIEGIVKAIERAQSNLQPATIKLAKGKLDGISFNRSPQSYLLNPETERAQYGRDTDIEMTLLRFDSVSGKPLGQINWFPLHGVSLNNKNHLISPDNKGYAEYLFEKDYVSDYGTGAFIAAFAQGHAGDVSPNRYGHEGGSDANGLIAVEHAGLPQYQTAKKLFSKAKEVIVGGVDYRHQFVEMDKVVLALTGTCPAAIGISMLAGTQDGEGVGKQGVTCDNIGKILPFFICENSKTPCQGVKPIAVETGTKKPHPWTPNILPFQIIKIGNLVIAGVPFELTTMSGRRIKATIAQTFGDEVQIVLAPLSNAYSGYVATPEEYQLQRYEGASTHFGAPTLPAIQQIVSGLAKAMLDGKPVSMGKIPPDLSKSQITLQTGVVFDAPPIFKKFGDVHQDVQKTYHPGDQVNVKFWGAHPKNNLRTQKTFLEIQKWDTDHWQLVSNDNDWETEYRWARDGIASSLITIVWRIPSTTPQGLYRIVHYGDAKEIGGKIKSYVGYSSGFLVQ